MDYIRQNALFFAFTIGEFGAGIVLGVRMMKAVRYYLRQFPPVDGVPLDWMGPDNPFGTRAREIWWVTTHWQPVPKLERMRQEMRRRRLHYVLWTFGFPFLCLALIEAAALVILVMRSL